MESNRLSAVDAGQGELPMAVKRPIKEIITDQEVMVRCRSMRDAIKLCVSLAPVDEQVVCIEIELDQAQWSRFKSGKAHFPDDKLSLLEDCCGNEIPTRYKALSRGYGLVKLKSELEKDNDRLMALLDQRDQELSVIKKFLKDTRVV